jgi:hypothetical protein
LQNDGNASASASENQSTLNSLPADGAEWIDFFVREMMVATSVDDARARAARMLEVLEKSINERASAETTDALQKVFMLNNLRFMLKLCCLAGHKGMSFVKSQDY